MVFTNRIFYKQKLRGGLFLIFNYNVPELSGWWRLMFEEDLKDDYFVLEKPLHKDFDKYKQKLIDDGVKTKYFILSYKTVDISPKEYEVVAGIGGLEAIKLLQNNYNLAETLEYSDFLNNRNVYYSQSFTHVRDFFYPKNDNKITAITKNFI